jgi:hypothetical protein
MTKKERKKYGLLPAKIAESDILSLGPFTIRALAKTHYLIALKMIDSATG